MASPMPQCCVTPTTPAPPDISELLNQRSGDALAELIKFYRPLLLALANRELENSLRAKVGASDIVQDTCQEITRRFSSINARQRCQFWAYLLLTLRHKLADARRRFKTSQRRDLRREVSLDRDELGNEAIQSAQQPVERMIADEDTSLLEQVLNRLPIEIQQLLQWRFREGMSYVEIGQLVQRSPDDVRMLIRRCLAKIRIELST